LIATPKPRLGYIPRPYIPQPKPKRLPTRKAVTIGIAAICNGGRNMIVTTDGMLSAEISADLSTFKMQFLGDWLFMFSGTLSNADLIMEEMRHNLAADPDTLSRAKIQATIRRAYDLLPEI
jgi:hypothetical protein